MPPWLCRYDASLRESCKADIDKNCAAEKQMAHGNAVVLRCLTRNVQSGNLADDCEQEVSRSVRMALWSWHEGQALTSACDSDVRKYCDMENIQKVSRFGIGKVNRCLAREMAVGSPLDSDCRQLVLAATPEDVKKDMISQGDPSESYVAAAQDYVTMSSLVNRQGRGMSMITITGWVAVFAMFSMSFVIMYMLFAAYKKYKHGSLDYVIVKGSTNVKRADD